MKKIILILLGVGALLYVGLYIYFYSIQDDRFKSVTLPPDHTFTFSENFEELNFESENGGKINSLLFKSDSSRGVICFWKGNGGNLETWGRMAPQFLKYKYDVIITDYRQHGKSSGDISLENFYSDAQVVYDFLKTRYSEDQIVNIGYSLGANIGAHVAATNNPSQTVLIEPRAKFENKLLDTFFFPFPSVSQFSFRPDLDIQKTKTPITFIAGTKSILYEDARALKKHLHPGDIFFEIPDADHASILKTKELDGIFRQTLD